MPIHVKTACLERMVACQEALYVKTALRESTLRQLGRAALARVRTAQLANTPLLQARAAQVRVKTVWRASTLLQQGRAALVLVKTADLEHMQASQAALHAHCVLPIRIHLQWHRYLVPLALVIQALLLEARSKQAVSATEGTAGQMLARVMSVLQVFTKT